MLAARVDYLAYFCLYFAMSLAQIKQKETKGKKNVLPKLRTILANPYKVHCPVLAENEVQELKDILIEAINESKHAKQSFATQSQIRLGMESSLRAINSARFSCVFISLSLRPAHLVRLIATTAAVKSSTAPIYAQPKLEDLTLELFGVKAMVLLLPLELNGISSKLDKWVESHKRSPVPKKTIKTSPKSKKERKTIEKESTKVENTKVEPENLVSKQEWNGDYISCSNDGGVRVSELDAQSEAENLTKALSKLGKELQTNTDKASPKEILPTTESMEIDSADSVEEDEFLPSELSKYRPVTVHQICPNPNKKPKKKRNKNKKAKDQQNKSA